MVQKINTKKYESIITSVEIDDREVNRIAYAKEQYVNLNPRVEHLDIGDYIFHGENGIDVVFELKEEDDFLNSITSETHHLHNQVYEMVSNYDYTFVIVISPDLSQAISQLYYSSGISMSLPQINGAISEYNTVSTVLFTQTRYQAFDLMVRQAGKIIQQKPFCYKFSKKSTNWALNSLMAMKGVDKKAEVIVRTLNLHTIMDVMRLSKEDLLKVDGVGDKLADKILRNIGKWKTYESDDKDQTKLI